MHDPLNVGDLVNDELRQRRESGYDVSAAEARVAATSSSDSDLEAIYLDLMGTHRRPDWAYAEPDTLEEILAALPALRQEQCALSLSKGLRQAQAAEPALAAEVGLAERADRVLGGWLGRIAGCNLGNPDEDGDTWTPERIRDYLRLAEAYPLRDYIPRLEPMPGGYPMRDCWPETTRGRIDGSARDDDIDYSILALWLLERYGGALRPDHLAEAMLSFLPYYRVTAGLLWGEEDYAAIVGLTVQGGWDTDSNGATAGSVAGTVLGAAALPSRFTEPLHDRTRSAVFGNDNSRISELARRTVRLIDDGRMRTAA